MTNDLIGFYDHSTGEQILREMTDEEQTKRDAEVANWLEKEAKAELEKINAKIAAESKLAALGLSPEDLKALIS